jgi:hypothetical protein
MAFTGARGIIDTAQIIGEKFVPKKCLGDKH